MRPIKYLLVLFIIALTYSFLTLTEGNLPTSYAQVGKSNEQGNTVIFQEDFSDQALSPEWFWVNENPSNWSLSDRSGFLRIISQQGTTHGNNTIENLLLRDSPSEPFSITTRIEFNPTQNYHEAGIYLYSDDDNNLKLVRLFNDSSLDGDVYLLWREKNGIIQASITQLASESSTELRLDVKGRFVIGSYRLNSGQYSFPLYSNKLHGLATVENRKS